METFTKEVMSSPSPKRHLEVSGVKDSGPRGHAWELSFSLGAVWEYPGVLMGCDTIRGTF